MIQIVLNPMYLDYSRFETISKSLIVLDDGTLEFATGFGSGITIAPNHVLTNAHVVDNSLDVDNPENDFFNDNPAVITRVRATTSAKQNKLVSRVLGNTTDIDAGRGANVNINQMYFLGEDFRKTVSCDDDIALLKTNNRLLDEDKVDYYFVGWANLKN